MVKKDELMQFAKTYKESDFIQKNESLLKESVNELSERDKLELALWYAKNVNVKLFQCFICVTNIRMSKQDAITCVDGFIKGVAWLEPQIWMYDAFCELTKHIDDTKEGYYEYVIMRCIEYSFIYVIQKIFEENVDIDIEYIDSNGESIKGIMNGLQDVQFKDYLQYYFRNKQIKEDCQKYFVGRFHKYEPKFEMKVNGYFETKAKSDCKELLKTYHKINLLKDDTSTEELRKFIVNDYNWDDGVAIPYFIIHHKNCDLALKKEIFELGAGDCLDRNIHSIYGKDPWERFIIELDDMIHESK